LIAHAKKTGITFSRRLRYPSADFLADLDMPPTRSHPRSDQYRALRHVAKLGKPMIISTGGAPWTTSCALPHHHAINPQLPSAVHLRYPAEVEELI